MSKSLNFSKFGPSSDVEYFKYVEIFDADTPDSELDAASGGRFVRVAARGIALKSVR
jgi:hypothetical protein